MISTDGLLLRYLLFWGFVAVTVIAATLLMMDGTEE